jgi:hypothetical protein
LEETITNRSDARSAQVTATASIGQMIEQGLSLVQRLEVLVQNKYAAETQVMAAWETARRVVRARTAAAAAGNSGGKTAAAAGETKS